MALEDRGYSGNTEEFLQALAQVDEIQGANHYLSSLTEISF